MANVTIEVKPKAKPQADTPVETPKLDIETISAVADKLKRLQLDPAHVAAVVEHIRNATPEEAYELIVTKLNELGHDPAKVAVIAEKLKTLFPKSMIDPATAAAVLTTGVGVINKLNIGDTAKALLIKLAIFAFGIFCGIGIVYKSGLPLPSDEKANPPANVSVYQKRIEELQTENTQLRKLLEQPPQPRPQPQPQPEDGPQVWPIPKTNPQPQPKTPPVVTPRPGEARPGFVIPK